MYMYICECIYLHKIIKNATVSLSLKVSEYLIYLQSKHRGTEQ